MNLICDSIALAQRNVIIDPFNVESWEVLVSDAQIWPIEEVRELVYERLVNVFPTGKFWKAYIEHEIRSRNYELVEKLFQRCLMRVLSIDLWRTYLKYVKDTKAKLSDGKEKMAQAYDFALDKIGMDINSYSIWNDYVKFLKKVEAVGSFAENQKIAAIRKIYQRGITNPMINIEHFWKDYVAFEQSINPILAEKLTADKSREYMNTRRVTKEYEACTRGLKKGAPGVPPTGSAEEKKQAEFWQKYISWERSNPLKVEDQTLITKRVMFAYEQCLLCLAHHPNIWFEAASFLQESAKLLADKGDVDTSKIFFEQVEALYEKCTTGVLQNCMLLHFGYADFLEQQVKFPKVHELFSNLLEIDDIEPSLCYIQYMKFCRRAEGTKSARLVFKKAREDYRISYHVYIAAALMEYYCTKDTKIAGNVFELGFKKFKSDPRYVSEYLHFLSHLNEDNNTRVLFERSLTSDALKPDQAMQIWNKFLEFETNVGDLFGIKKVEKRRCLALDFSDKMMSFPTARLIDRYKYIDLYPCSSEELMSMGYESLEILSAAKVSTSFNGISKIEEIERSPSKPPIANMQPSKLDNIASTPVSAVNKDGTPLKKIFKPDTSQMVPFKPKFKWITGEHRVSGGGFPLPVAASALCQMLPPPDCFQGPFVVVDRLMDVFMTMRLPDGHNASLSDKSFSVGNVDKSTILHNSNSDHYNGIPSLILSNGQQEIESMVDINKNRSTRPVGTEASKRIRPSKHGRHDPRSDDEEETSTPAPTNDVYRQRQQKKLK